MKSLYRILYESMTLLLAQRGATIYPPTLKPTYSFGEG
jgi:hypothetical protein